MRPVKSKRVKNVAFFFLQNRISDLYLQFQTSAMYTREKEKAYNNYIDIYVVAIS